MNPIRLTIVLCALFLAGCASSHPPTTMASCQAECLVCKHNADLACLKVDVDKDTPTYAYNGKTYYFCSDECKTKFAKNPTKYLPQ